MNCLINTIFLLIELISRVYRNLGLILYNPFIFINLCFIGNS